METEVNVEDGRIEISLDEEFGKLLVHCVGCGREFDPKSKKHKDIPTINFCPDCFNEGKQDLTTGNA